MIQYFASLGHTCPLTTNPADFALDIVSVDLREEKNEVISRGKVQRLIRQFAATQQSEKLAVRDGQKTGELGLAGLEGRDYTPMYVAMPILLKRGLLCFKRRPDLALARIVQVVGLGVFAALFFAPLKTDYLSFQNRLGAVQQIVSREFRLCFRFREAGDGGAYLGISVLCWPIAERWPVPDGAGCILQGTAEQHWLYLLSAC